MHRPGVRIARRHVQRRLLERPVLAAIADVPAAEEGEAVGHVAHAELVDQEHLARAAMPEAGGEGHVVGIGAEAELGLADQALEIALVTGERVRLDQDVGLDRQGRGVAPAIGRPGFMTGRSAAIARAQQEVG